MRATITFNLPNEADEHQAAIDGSKWKSVVREIDNELRNNIKHGSKALTPQEIRDSLHEHINGRGLLLE